MWEICFFLLWVVFSVFKLLGKCFSNWWSGCAWRWRNVERNWRGHTAWLSGLADAWGVAERSKTFCGVKYETFNGKGGERWVWWYGQVLEETWKTKSVNNYSWRLCSRWNFRQILRWTTKSGSAGNRGCSFWTCSKRSLDGSFGGQKLQKMRLERHFGVESLVDFCQTKFENSYNVGE